MRFTKNSDVKVLYMGTPRMSANVLEALIEAGYQVIGVVSQTDKEIGRHKRLEKTPTKIIAEKYNIPVYEPQKIRLDFEFAKKLNFDVIVTMAYGQIIPQELLDLSTIGNVNLHGSILPKYRGAAPIQRAIMDGEKETGISLMEMIQKMDAGEVYDIRTIEIKQDDTYSSLCDKLSSLAAKMIVEDLLSYCNHALPSHKQDEELVTIAKKITVEEEHIPLNLSIEATSAYLRGLSEEPGAYWFLRGKKLKIYNAKAFSNEKIAEVGAIVPNKKHFLVQLNDGLIELSSVQLEGKKKMDGVSFLQGAHFDADTKVE